MPEDYEKNKKELTEASLREDSSRQIIILEVHRILEQIDTIKANEDLLTLSSRADNFIEQSLLNFCSLTDIRQNKFVEVDENRMFDYVKVD